MLQSYPAWQIRELQNVIETIRNCVVKRRIFCSKSWLSQQPRDPRLGCRRCTSLMMAAKETEVIEEALREAKEGFRTVSAAPS